MTALIRLVSLLKNEIPTNLSRIKSNTTQLDKVITELQKHNKTAGAHVPEDLQRIAVNKFWNSQRFENLKDARHVAFGLCMPVANNGISIMEDQQRFQSVLNEHTGIGQWLKEPRKFRRCYQGLIRSYFHSNQNKASESHRINRNTLRVYLYQNSRHIIEEQNNPEWVGAALENTALFDKYPCTPYAADVLSGNTERFDAMCESLGIQKTSWFHHELVLEQIRQVTQKEYTAFVSYIPQFIALLKEHGTHRNQGLTLILNRYASATNPALHEILRNAAVEWWGNPWLPSNDSQWGGVEKSAREMVSFWLKSEFVEAFFSKLAEDGLGDKRRANFWLRYVKLMDNIQFALGPTALRSNDPDFKKLREKMNGLYAELKGTTSSNNAFIMTMGDLVAVEFSGMGNAFYCYDKKAGIPFDFTAPLEISVDGINSLKSSYFCWKKSHKDGIYGWSSWEDLFEATLKQHFNLTPNTPAKLLNHITDIHPIEENTEYELSHKFGRDDCMTFAQEHNFPIHDLRDRSGNLWIATDDKNIEVNAQLLKFGFRYRPDKGWWK